MSEWEREGNAVAEEFSDEKLVIWVIYILSTFKTAIMLHQAEEREAAKEEGTRAVEKWTYHNLVLTLDHCRGGLE